MNETVSSVINSTVPNMRTWINQWKVGLPLLATLGTAVNAWDAGYSTGIQVDGTNFALNGNGMSYRMHVNEVGDLVNDHFGGPATETVVIPDPQINGWVYGMGRIQREYPDLGRGDFRLPAVHIHHAQGYTVSQFIYDSHDVVQGKPPLPGLPATFGMDDQVSTLIVHLYDNHSAVALDLSYSIFPEYDAIVRSAAITNKGDLNITVEKAASFSVDLPYQELDMINVHGDWAREQTRQRSRVDYGVQSFGSTTVFSSHLHNPFFALINPESTENQGDAWGFNLVYTGSFSVDVEKGSQGLTRAMIGINPFHLSWPLGPNETLTTPEAVSVYSNQGVGGVSRMLHRLYRNNLMKSKYATETRPILLNSWEGLGPVFNQSTIETLAGETADLGISMLVLDDGWFGVKYPRINDRQGLGDWTPNPEKFPNGLPSLVNNVTSLTVANTSDKLLFGLWFEPEMVNPNSSLYEERPEWVLSADDYPRSLTRNQLILNVALPDVQQFIIDSVSYILGNSSIHYVKWDHNRGAHEMPTPSTMHQYMLGMYHVFETLTSRFPDVIWEGCASGGGRFDPGVLQWFPQIWTSDDTDALERIRIQFGTSLAYPPSAMSAHVSNVPNGITGRTTPFKFRAHVAMMGGSFGYELNPPDLTDDDRAQVPTLNALAAKVNPYVVQGDFWRLQLPETSQWPAAMFIAQDKNSAVLFYFQQRALYNHARPYLRLQGLDAHAKYTIDGNVTYSGATLMNVGIQYAFQGDLDSTIMFLEKA